jgi:hypothetical protein
MIKPLAFLYKVCYNEADWNKYPIAELEKSGIWSGLCSIPIKPNFSNAEVSYEKSQN